MGLRTTFFLMEEVEILVSAVDPFYGFYSLLNIIYEININNYCVGLNHTIGEVLTKMV